MAQSRLLARVEPFGFPILILLLFTGILKSILWPVVELMTSLIQTLFQLY